MSYEPQATHPMALELGRVPGARAALDRIAAAHHVTARDVLERGKSRSVAAARAHFLHVLRTSTDLSFPEIGKLLGLDHTTVMAGVRRHEERIAGHHPQNRSCP